MTNWGGSKSVYYNTDAITTEQEALDEEVEARRIQQKRLQGLSEADFGFDEDEWAGEKEGGDEDDNEDADGSVIFEKLPQLQISPDASAEERFEILKKRYPELEGFASDLVNLQPTWEALKLEANNDKTNKADSPAASVASAATTKFRALSAYLGGLSMYFAILTSPAQRSKTGSGDEDGQTTPPSALPPTEIRDHGILDSVKQCQTTWYQVQHLQSGQLPSPESSEDDDESMIESDSLSDNVADLQNTELPNKLNKRQCTSTTKSHSATSSALAASQARRAARLASTEASLALLPEVLASSHARSTKNPTLPTATDNENDTNNETGDAPPLPDIVAAQKAAKRKSLRFYTSQIAQKASKREGAKARALAGDEDLPYQERWRDRVQRLNREAEAKGRDAGNMDGDESGDQSGEDDDRDMTNLDRELEGEGMDSDYINLTAAAQTKKAAKCARRASSAHPNASKQSNSQPSSHGGLADDGRREIGYQISANKGLTPKRKKENKNPRVKKRRKFEDKSKKLRSMKPTFKPGGEGRGGYGGELTGIKTGVVRGVKF